MHVHVCVGCVVCVCVLMKPIVALDWGWVLAFYAAPLGGAFSLHAVCRVCCVVLWCFVWVMVDDGVSCMKGCPLGGCV